MMQASLPIGIFDSGVGGLTVFKAIAARLPKENLIYLGDTARLPYGTKSKDTIGRYAKQAASQLVARGIKMLVIACNTATAAALPLLREAFTPLPVLGVIEPGAQAAVAASCNGTIAIIATEATINGGAYQYAIHALRPDVRVYGRSCTLFVPLVEEGWIEGPVVEAICHRYLDELFAGDAPPDTLVLGCTHFPMLRNAIQHVLGPNVRIVDSAATAAAAVEAELTRTDMLCTSSAQPTRHYMTTDNASRFATTGSLFLGTPLTTAEVELVDL